VINDVIHDFYFQSGGISPISVHGKGRVETRKSTSTSNDTLTFNPGINLNMITAVLWGAFLHNTLEI